MPNWNLLSQLTPTDTDWSYSAPTDAAWFKLQHFGDFAYPNRAVGLIADAEFLSNGEVLRLEGRIIYHSSDSQILFLPPPLILTPTNRRIAVRRLARTPSYTPWQLFIFGSNAMPIYNEFPQNLSEKPITDSLPTTFSAPQYNPASPAATYQALAANTARRKFSVTNTGTAAIYIDFDAPAAQGRRAYTVGAGGTYVSDFEYTGTVFVWSSNNTAQACEIRELI